MALSISLDGIINQSRYVKPPPVDTKLSHRPIAEIAKKQGYLAKMAQKATKQGDLIDRTNHLTLSSF
ncbi:MAG: hypothetical protein GY777_27385 [Candidatus Brocadiaceae bacterium]|nr:hypothetical protein [Candidatus Brocadiaceae bacterium]